MLLVWTKTLMWIDSISKNNTAVSTERNAGVSSNMCHWGLQIMYILFYFFFSFFFLFSPLFIFSFFFLPLLCILFTLALTLHNHVDSKEIRKKKINKKTMPSWPDLQIQYKYIHTSPSYAFIWENLACLFLWDDQCRARMCALFLQQALWVHASVSPLQCALSFLAYSSRGPISDLRI